MANPINAVDLDLTVEEFVAEHSALLAEHVNRSTSIVPADARDRVIAEWLNLADDFMLAALARFGTVGTTLTALANAPAGWTERFLGDLRAAPVVDLAVGVNPTVTVNNDTETADQVADATFTSNANDPAPSTAQGTVTSFGTDGSTGLVLAGAAVTANFSGTVFNAPHLWTQWAEVLGEDPRPGVEYVFMVRMSAHSVATNFAAAGIACYGPNDAVPPTDISSNRAKVDNKRLCCWLEQQGGVLGAYFREDTTDYTQIFGSRLPSPPDVLALIFHNGAMISAAVGEFNTAEDRFPEPEEMVPIDTWLGSQLGFTARSYLIDRDRLVMVAQQQPAVVVNATWERVRVLSRGGA